MHFDDPDLDRAVGAVARAAANLEGLTLATLCALIQVSQEIGRVVLPDTMDRRLSAIKEIGPRVIASGPFLDELVAWCGRAKSAYTERSKIVHAQWSPLPADFLNSLKDPGGFAVRDEHLLDDVLVYSAFPRRGDFAKVEDFRSLDDMKRASDALIAVGEEAMPLFAKLSSM